VADRYVDPFSHHLQLAVINPRQFLRILKSKGQLLCCTRQRALVEPAVGYKLDQHTILLNGDDRGK